MGDFNLELLRDSLLCSLSSSKTTTSSSYCHNNNYTVNAADFSNARENSIINCSSIHLHDYITAFNEIARFFTFINYGFAFVGSNVTASCAGLSIALNNNPPITTVEDALKIDVVNNSKYNYICCVTWLHRPLELLILLLEGLSEMEENKNIYELSLQCYEQSLSRYHNFIVRKMTKLLLRTLPDSTNLRLRTMKYDSQTAKKLMKEVAIVAREVHGVVNELLITHAGEA